MTEATVARTSGVEIPWAAWQADRRETLAVPKEWRVHVLDMAGAPALGDAGIRAALDAPIDAPPLERLGATATRAAIAIDDITRPTRTAPILCHLVDRLTAAGMRAEDVTVVVASGAHRRASRHDLELKLGRDLLGRVQVVCHDPLGDLAPTVATLGGVPVRLARAFAEADLRIGVGAVMPHPFAGFSGGGKIVIPGLADLDVLARTHKFALMGLAGSTSGLDGNRFRGEMERAVREIGLHWTVNVAVNAERDTAFVGAGDFVAAHRQAAAAAERIGATAPPSALLDALIVNAYPKDGEALQLESALVALRRGMLDWLRPWAPVILTGACHAGFGHHGLFAPGGRLYRQPSAKGFLGDRALWVLGTGVAPPELRTLLPERYPAYSQWDALVSDLRRTLPVEASVGVVPCGPLQVPARRGGTPA